MNGGEVILADEPTGALDSKSGEIVMNVLTKLNNNGHTIILVTHNFDIAAYAKRVIEIHDGRIISERYAEKPSTPIFLPPIEIKKNIKHSNFRNLLLESFTMSIQALRAHKLRSMLTMLGIIIGIASVISVVSLGRASEEKILSNIRSLGANTIEIFPGQGFGDMNAGRVKTLSPTDVAILDSQTYLEGASPTITTSGVVVFGSISSNVMVTGVGSKYFRIKGMKTKMGSFFNEADIIANTSVVVIDHKARASLFPNGENPIGKVIFFNMSPLEIIGVAQKQEGPDYSTNPTIWIPYSTVMYKISGTHEIDSIVVKVHDGINSQIAEKNITILLTLSHDGMKDFFTFNVDSIKLAIEKTTNTMTLLISCIALISLIVGGIGVMNIMLVSVTERTSEIGVRMAIGAKRRNILTQFLIEAVLICLCGGIIGIVFSTLLIPTANMFFDELSLSYSPSSIIVALCCSTFVGVFFGFVPARNASRLSPIDALARDY
jgi:macrolide transport system ATP-binding/permease protein